MVTRPSLSFRMRTPYTRCWDVAPQHVYDTLVEEGYSPRQSEGELLALRCFKVRMPPELPREPFIALDFFGDLFSEGLTAPGPLDLIATSYAYDLVASALSKLPQPVSQEQGEETADAFYQILLQVPAGRPSDSFSPLQLQWDMEDMKLWHHRDEPPPLLQPELLKWRHWKPRNLKDEEPTTQRALEVHLRAKWAERLLAHFAPYAEHLPHVAPLVGPNFRTELGHLLGDTRFRTIRQHCLAYEGLRKRGFVAIPWKEADVRHLLNALAEAEVTPYKIQQVWHTLKWLSKIFGLLNIDEVHRLKTKKAALEETLADTATKPQRKATVPSKEVVWALEEGASGLMSAGAAGPEGQAAPGRERHTMMDAYIMSLARFQLGCSARFNDLQHVHPKDLHVTTHTLELQAWQTKTVSAAKIRKQPVPLICPKFSFTGKDWWLGMVTVIRKMTKLDQFKEMDFLIPTVNKDFNGLIARPSTPDRALRWLKDALVRQGVTRTLVDPLTWHSFRVFIPDCAFQLGIPRTQRQYLGNWLTESTADVYTREKRNVVVSIWDKVGSRVHSLNMGPGRLRREDLDHPDWEDQVEQVEDLEEPVPLARESPQSTSPRKSTPGSEGSWEQVGSLLPDPPSGTGFVKRQLFKTPAHGGLRVIVSTAKTSGNTDST